MRKQFLILLSFLIFTLVGCGNSNDDEELEIKDNVQAFLEGYQSLDGSIGKYLADYDKDNIQFNGFQSILAQQIIFKVGKVEHLDNEFLVNVKINNVDFQAAFEQIIEEYTANDTEEDILNKLINKLEDESAQRKDFDVEILIQQTGDTYEIILTPELSNALLGGYNEYLTSLTGGMINE
jgi:hypothetical protein